MKEERVLVEKSCIAFMARKIVRADPEGGYKEYGDGPYS
jgi:hypothetical protein